MKTALGLLAALTITAVAPAQDWPPALANAKAGTVTLRSDKFLEVPASVETARKEAGAAEFTVAAKAPTVLLAYHDKLGPDAAKRRLWSSWGDICVAGDGKVYCAIGDHGDDAGGDARCFLYVWDPKQQTLTQIVDMNAVIPPQKGQPAWSKVHAKIDEGPDGKIYFSCTLNDGNRAGKPPFAERWNEKLPGGQLYQYDPQTGKTSVFASLPPQRCTATSILDQRRNIWWCNLESGPNGLWGLDLKTKKPVYQAPAGSMAFNRNFALARDGALYFNGEGGIWKYDPTTEKLARTKAEFADSPGMRSSTPESKAGHIYGTTQKSGQLFRYTPAKDELTMLGPDWMKGDYATVCVLSPDERFLYYLPGAHGKATNFGTPVIQYEIGTGKRKVLAFLAKACEQDIDYVPAGTYGVKLSPDGGTLYVTFNGHPGERGRPKTMKPIGFGLCAFAAIQIPESER